MFYVHLLCIPFRGFIMRITDQTIKKLIAQSKNSINEDGEQIKYKYHSLGNNLWLRVSTAKMSATWLYRTCVKDNSKKNGYRLGYHTIGKYPVISLKKAGEIADDLYEKFKIGENPLLVEPEKVVVLKDIWDKWFNAAPLSNNYRIKCEGMFKNHFQKHANTPLNKLSDKIAWQTIIQPILDAGHKNQARHVLQKLKQIARFAKSTYLIDFSLFESMKIPEEYRTKRERNRTMEEAELKIFLKALEASYLDNTIDITAHHLLKLILLLGTRKCELALLTWDKYDANEKTIFLTETKNTDNLIIKLPPQAICLLEDMRQIKSSEYIFHSMQKPKNHICIRSILYFLQKITTRANIKNLTVHDLRRTFASRLTTLRFRLELIEKALNHRLQGTAKHYQHDQMLEERHEMLVEWANYLDELLLSK